MTDLPQSYPDAWTEAPFRELFLHLLPAEDAEAFRRIGLLLYLMTLEYSSHWPNPAEGGTQAELRAIVGDLRFLEGFLRLSIAPEGEGLHQDDPGARLPALASSWASELEDLAHRVESELGQ